MSRRVTILAWGNRGRRDDGVALHMAERLDALLEGHPHVRVEQFHQLAPELAETLGECDLALFIDAHMRADASDVVFERLEPAESIGLDTHHCDPSSLLRLCLSLGFSAPEAYLLAIRGHDWDFGDELSPSTQQAMEAGLQMVLRLIDAAQGETGATGVAGVLLATA